MKTYLKYIAISIAGCIVVGALFLYTKSHIIPKNRQSLFLGSMKIDLKKSFSFTYVDKYKNISISIEDTENDILNARVLQKIQSNIKEYEIITEERKKENNPMQYFLSVNSYTINHPTGKSIIFDQSTFMGGAHGSHIKYFIVVDANNKVLNLNDVTDLSYDKIAAKVQPLLEMQIKERIQDQEYQGSSDEMFILGTKPTKQNYEHWYLKNNSLVFYFPQYAIGPYAWGDFEVEIPLEKK